MSSQAELAEARQRLSSLESELESNRQMLSSAAADLAAAKEHWLTARKGPGRQLSALAGLEQRQEEARRSIMQTAAAVANLRNSITQAEERIAAMDRDGQRLQAEMA